MKMKRINSLVVFLMVLVLVGCSSNNPSATNKESEENNHNEETIDIAVLLWSRGFEFMVALDEGIKEEAEKLGANVTVLDGQEDSQVQLRQIEDNIAKGVDLIILAPNNSDELVPGVKKANDAGIPVVTVDSIVAEGAEIVSSISFNNAEAGQVAAQYIRTALGEGTVLELTGSPAAYHAIFRGGGFNQGMEESTDFEVISQNAEWSAEESQSITADSLTANSEINAIFTHNDDMQRGVLSGLRQVDKLKTAEEDGYIVSVGVDGTPEALERIRKGEQAATVNQDPFEMGALAVQTAIKYIKGEDVPKEQFTPPVLITKENVDDPDLWGNVMKNK
ncbi:D-ribose ABC transporter substrate-binding protein [Bacillus sp. J14TS2]|uniref:sugar ABC transporter substrate-binding protein n=1 Tax=Bacillus sp. J14TS2 TaxID=2807188 RepID=UPI001B25C491|nr:sugar ABC transporter substrate-binding protein [Bacillus sp. J14TS2]GIN69574.1 D-ribose ABC transporter substrate-binding protein [Bacillus sp. J14TS2]